MVYKIESVKDLEVLPPVTDDIKAILYYHAKVLDEQYGDSTSDGGYILYATPEARCEDILSYFDYRHNIPEYVERLGDFCVAGYVTNNEHVVVIVLSACSAPAEITKEIEDIL